MGLLYFDSFGSIGSFEPIDENLYCVSKEPVYRLYFQTLIVMSDNMDSFKNSLMFINSNVTEDDGWDIFSKVASEQITKIENLEMRAILINLIKSHRKDDCDGPEIVLK